MSKLTIARIAFVALALLILPYKGHAQSGEQVPAKLVCSAHTANPAQLRAFQTEIIFAMSGNTLEATRNIRSGGGGAEHFTGTVGPTGAILVTGEGENKNGGAWLYEFRGQRRELKNTVLAGKLQNTQGAVGSRECTLTFIKPKWL